jgi:hypothetical protein
MVPEVSLPCSQGPLQLSASYHRPPSVLSVRDRVLHPCKTTGKIMILSALFSVFFDRKLQAKDFGPNYIRISPI